MFDGGGGGPPLCWGNCSAVGGVETCDGLTVADWPAALAAAVFGTDGVFLRGVLQPPIAAARSAPIRSTREEMRRTGGLAAWFRGERPLNTLGAHKNAAVAPQPPSRHYRSHDSARRGRIPIITGSPLATMEYTIRARAPT